MVGNGLLFIISAPSGTGKTTVCRYLLGLHKELVLSISATTRIPRVLEKDGLDYFFIAKEEFEKRIEENEFLEYAKVFENYYGTPVEFVKKHLANGRNVIFDIDWQGMRKIKKSISSDIFTVVPNVATIFLIPPSIDALRNRLRNRGDSDEQVEKRVAGFQNDAEKADEYDFVVVNDDLNDACRQIESIYNAEVAKLQKHKNVDFIKNVLLASAHGGLYE